MSEEKMLELQMQVRQNQQDMLEYVKELDGWEEEVKRKDAELKQQPVVTNKVRVETGSYRELIFCDMVLVLSNSAAECTSGPAEESPVSNRFCSPNGRWQVDSPKVRLSRGLTI
jgi:hypothetical protein